MSQQKKITVIGAGLMGSALAKGFAAAGNEVRIWNRTFDRAKAVGGGTTPIESLTEAIAGSKLVVVSVSNYDASDAILRADGVVDGLAEATLIQITSGTPNQARQSLEWAEKHGISYLDAKILGYPSSVGTEWATVFYAGSRDLYDRHEATFKQIAENSVYVDEEIGSAATIDCAILAAYYGGSLAALQGAAMCAAEGLDPERFFAYKDTYVGLVDITSDAARAMVAANDFSGDQCSLDTHVGALQHIAALSRDAGIDSQVTEQLLSSYKKAQDVGLGGQELPAVYQTILTK